MPGDKMRWSKKASTSYLPVSNVDSDDESQGPVDGSLRKGNRHRICTAARASLLTAALFVILLLLAWIVMGKPTLLRESSQQDTTAGLCTDPYMRLEWRSLSTAEKHSYINAVKCLASKPSRLGTNGTIYDDFPYAHSDDGANTHESAGFLPWHRYFIKLYEDTLRNECGYDGYLPYWDWTLDWEDIPGSLIWDPETGFGGDGNSTGEEVADKGRCVIDGPFADFRPVHLLKKYKPHCLSRGFLKGEDLRRETSLLQPSRVAKILSETDYEEFLLHLENTAHSAIPKSVNGDFYRFTAPNDPVFYLHHAQLDRLWWLWQNADPSRLTTYDGKAQRHSNDTASVSDMLYMNGLAPDLVVTEMFNTQRGMLCYKYSR